MRLNYFCLTQILEKEIPLFPLPMNYIQMDHGCQAQVSHDEQTPL